MYSLVKEDEIWTGCRGFAGGMWFISDYEGKTEKIVGGKKIINVPSIWFTNLEHGRRHRLLRLMTMADNIKFSKHKEVRGKGYQKYDNYDAIEVPFTDAIPGDYDGVMGVPISFLDKYCPEQFEIMGMCENEDLYALKTRVYNRDECQKAYFAKFGKKGTYDLNASGVLIVDGIQEKVYQRILIRARRLK